MEKPRKQYPTQAQKARLLSILEADAELKQGKFSASFNKKIAEGRWKQVAEEVNSIPGAKKTWTEWRKCWQDMKSKTKKKQSILKRSHSLTGGGPPAPLLTQEDLTILGTMSESVLTGHSDSTESAVQFQDMCQIELSEILEGLGEPASTSVQPEVDTATEGQQEPELVEVVTVERENQKEKNQTAKKPIAKKRLQKSIDIANKLQKTLEEKNKIKERFYEQFLVEMRRHTEALTKIADRLAK